MYKQKTIAVVVPAFNEEKQIAKVIDSIPLFVDCIIIVNDCSTDETINIVKNHTKFLLANDEKTADKKSNIILLNHVKNQGVGGAIATGYKWARDKNYDIAVVMAGDGQMCPTDLNKLLDPVVEGKADYSKGNRFKFYKKIPKLRFIGNFILSYLTKFVSGYWHVLDSQSGYTAINKFALKVIDWDLMYKGYGQPNDLLVRLNIENMRVIDVPITPLYYIGEQSKLSIFKVILPIALLIFSLFFYRVRKKYLGKNFHLIGLFYIFSLLKIMISLIFFFRIMILYFTYDYIPVNSLLIFLFFLFMGVAILLFAILFDYFENKHLSIILNDLDVKK